MLLSILLVLAFAFPVFIQEKEEPIGLLLKLNNEKMTVKTSIGGQFYAIECKLTENPDNNDLKGLRALRKYYGEESIIKSFLACKVDIPFMYKKDVFVSNFIDCDLF